MKLTQNLEMHPKKPGFLSFFDSEFILCYNH
jgi:hypothetical protein